MSDTFLEVLVNKRATFWDIILKILILVAGVVLTLAMIWAFLVGFDPTLALFAIAGVIYGAYKLYGLLNVEFEYVLTNGDLDVDKIFNRNFRKRLITVKCSTFETFGKYKEIDHKSKNYQTRLIVSSSPSDPDAWYATFRHQKLGHTLLVFSANEKLLNGIKVFLPKQLAFEVFHGMQHD